jgi:hypothetical protein
VRVRAVAAVGRAVVQRSGQLSLVCRVNIS